MSAVFFPSDSSAAADELTEGLRRLFKTCDTNGTGFIRKEELRELCKGYGISSSDSDSIFNDLDHDGDGTIDFDDFSKGFREYMSPAPGQLTLTPPRSPDYKGKGPSKAAVDLPEERNKGRKQTLEQWHDFLDRMADNASSVISASQLKSMRKNMPSAPSSPTLLACFEDMFRALVKDVQQLQQENHMLEETYRKEREKHEHHLRQIEDELDTQVAKIEEKLRQQMREEAETERQALKAKVEEQMSELQAHLNAFQTIDDVLSEHAGGQIDEDRLRLIQNQLEEASHENRKLRLTLNDTHTTIAVLRKEMAQLRSHYQDTYKSLSSERENMLEYMKEQDHLTRQLSLLHEANRHLQDMNDNLRDVIEPATGAAFQGTSENSDRSKRSRGSVIGNYLDSGPFGLCPEFAHDRASSPVSEVDSIYDRETDMKSPSDHGFVDWARNEAKYGADGYPEDTDSGFTTMRDIGSDVDDGNLPAGMRILVTTDTEPPAPNTNLLATPEKAELYRSTSLQLPTRESSGHRSSASGKSPPSCPPSPVVTKYKTKKSKRSRSTTPSISRCPIPVVAPQPETCVPSNVFEPTGPPDRMYKIVFAGDAAVGKSTFIIRISTGVFVPSVSSTLGVDFHVKTFRVDEKNVSLQLWDTAGQERFRSITKSYFRRADGVMLMYDVTSERSYLNVRAWMEVIQEVIEKRMPIMLVANKTDMRDGARLQGKSVVEHENGIQLAREFGAIFMETSAKSGSNVLDAVVLLTREMLSQEDLEVQTSTLRVHENTAKKTACCGK